MSLSLSEGNAPSPWRAFAQPINAGIRCFQVAHEGHGSDSLKLKPVPVGPRDHLYTHTPGPHINTPKVKTRILEKLSRDRSLLLKLYLTGPVVNPNGKAFGQGKPAGYNEQKPV